MGCRSFSFYDYDCNCYPSWSSLTADIGALAGLSLTYLCAPSLALRCSISWLSALALLRIVR